MSDNLSPAAQYLLDVLKPSRRTTILDVGANPANVAAYTPLLAAGGCHVVGFEPHPGAFAELAARQSPNETYFNSAVGDGSRLNLHVMQSSGMTSIFPVFTETVELFGRPAMGRLKEIVAIDSVALDDLPDLPPVDMLKIDIQGGELLVLEHARRALSEAVCIIIEMRYMRLYHSEPMWDGVHKELTAQGFYLHKFLSTARRQLDNSQKARLRWRRVADQLVDGDSVYLRDPLRMAEFSDDQLAHLALLAASVFGSHSLAIRCLDLLVARDRVPADAPARYVDLLPDDLKN